MRNAMKDTSVDPGTRIDVYVNSRTGELHEALQGLRRVVRKAVPKVTESVNSWGVPTFEWFGPMAYFMAGKNHVTFGFLRGTSLSDPSRLLEGTGKNLRHIKVKTLSDLGKPGFLKLIKEAAALNRSQPQIGSMKKAGQKTRKAR